VTQQTRTEDILALAYATLERVEYIIQRNRQDAHLQVAADTLVAAMEAKRSARRLREAVIAESERHDSSAG
jgi:hypothetical protein